MFTTVFGALGPAPAPTGSSSIVQVLSWLAPLGLLFAVGLWAWPMIKARRGDTETPADRWDRYFNGDRLPVAEEGTDEEDTEEPRAPELPPGFDFSVYEESTN